MRHLVLFLTLLGLACDKPTTPVSTGDVGLPNRQCMVGRFRIVTPGQAESPQPPVCAVLCQWDKGAGYHDATGYADAVPVPCSWYGHQVIVERWVNPDAVQPVKVTP
jgi:hypothetical protein